MPRSSWNQVDDDALRRAMSNCRIDKVRWEVVAERAGLTWRGGKGCRVRWMHHLDPELNRAKFTEEESRTVVIGFVLIGSRWSRIAKELPGRTDGAVRNCWKSIRPRMKYLMSKIILSPTPSDGKAIASFTTDKGKWREDLSFGKAGNKGNGTGSNYDTSSSSSSEEASPQLLSQSSPTKYFDIFGIHCANSNTTTDKRKLDDIGKPETRWKSEEGQWAERLQGISIALDPAYCFANPNFTAENLSNYIQPSSFRHTMTEIDNVDETRCLKCLRYLFKNCGCNLGNPEKDWESTYITNPFLARKSSCTSNNSLKTDSSPSPSSSSTFPEKLSLEEAIDFLEVDDFLLDMTSRELDLRKYLETSNGRFNEEIFNQLLLSTSLNRSTTWN